MKKLNKEKMLELLREIDNDIYLEGGNFYNTEDDFIFSCSDENWLINEIETDNTLDWGNNCGFVIHYLHQHKDEIIADGYTDEVIRDVIENKLHLKITNEGYITYEDIKNTTKYTLMKFNNFVLGINGNRMFTYDVNNLLATIVRNILDNEEVE